MVYKNEKWSGEKMILTPYQIDHQFNRTEIVNWLAKENDKRNYGIVALTPSFSDGEFWESCGAELARSKDLSDKVSKLKSGIYDKVMVFANRYDGIDLPDASCRILVVDNKPYGHTLDDKYQEEVRSNSQIINIKVAQKIEQGLGRGVRGEKDYCAIILTGSELVGAVRNNRFKRFFSPQTQQQLNIGNKVTQFAVEDATEQNPRKITKQTIDMLLKRDDGWKAFYKMEMDKIESASRDESILDILQLERNAEMFYQQENYPKAKDCIDQIINKYVQGDSIEEGWYIQEMARLVYPMSKLDSNRLQVGAHRKNRSLLKPENGMMFRKLEVEDKRIDKIIGYVQEFEDYSNLKSNLETILGHLDFNPDTKKFEIALEQVGNILGFSSERPEEFWKAGPDNLWCLPSGKFLIIECKSGTKSTRAEIVQNETEQMLNSTRWFEEKYINAEGTPVMIINTRMVARGAFLPKEGLIMTKSGLSKLKSRVRKFYKEFSNRSFDNLSNTIIQEWINTHELNESKILQLFETPKYYK